VGRDEVPRVPGQLVAGVAEGGDLGDERPLGQRDRLVVTGDRDVNQRRQQRLLAAEDLVDGLDRHAGPRGDRGQWCGRVARIDEQDGRGVQDRRTGQLRLLLPVNRLISPLDNHRASVVLYRIEVHSIR
jgi:hypothetical protein